MASRNSNSSNGKTEKTNKKAKPFNHKSNRRDLAFFLYLLYANEFKKNNGYNPQEIDWNGFDLRVWREVNAIIKKRREFPLSKSISTKWNAMRIHNSGRNRIVKYYTIKRRTLAQCRLGAKNKYRNYDFSHWKKVMELREKGLGLRRIAKATGYSITGVNYIVSKGGKHSQFDK
jgi:hypothetical protein